jgi:cytochrome c
LLASLSACGGGEKAADSTSTDTVTTETVTTEAVAPAISAPALPAAGITYASLTGSSAKGEKVFTACKTCHVGVEGVNRIGPSLWNVVGRTAGSIADYQYTAANKNSGIVWTEEKLFEYLVAPQKVVPGTKMAYALKPAQERVDVIAYLKTLS